jgi:23S rRNA (uridine2552-2'-O)-methyltransferase
LKKNKISKNWINKQHRDIYFKKSKVLGYRSRSSFKLIDLDKKFKFLKKNTYLLDLGSSPGGWSQVAIEKIINGKILAVDIKDMEKINKVSFLKGDLLDVNTCNKIQNFFDKKIDVVISDMATNTSGNKSLDSFNTGQLCLNAMNLSKNILNNSGVFLSKLFMGSIFVEINKKANQYFKKVVKFKPLSSRQESKEIYLYCKGIR